MSQDFLAALKDFSARKKMERNQDHQHDTRHPDERTRPKRFAEDSEASDTSHIGSDDSRMDQGVFKDPQQTGTEKKMKRTTFRQDEEDSLGQDMSANENIHNEYDEEDFAAPPSTLPQATKATLARSGLVAAASYLFRTMNEHELMCEELAWQRNIKGDLTKLKVFREEVLHHTDLVTFAFMKPNSPFIHILHSPAAYHTKGAELDLKGVDIGFVGDRTKLQTPIPVVMALISSWAWVTKPFLLDALTLEHYYADPRNTNTLWPRPGAPKGMTPSCIPRMLLLPATLLAYCVTSPCTPWDLHQATIQYVTSNAEVQCSLEDCVLILNWCVAASHADKQGNSWLAHPLEPVVTNGEVFHTWAQQRMNMVFSQFLTNTAPYPPNTQHGQDWNTLARQLKQGIVEGLRPTLAFATKREENDTASDAVKESGKKYDSQQVYMLRGFSHAYHVTELQPLWAAFQTTKNQEAHRLEITEGMEEWALNRRVEIVHDLTLSDKTLAAIVKMQFNPVGCGGTAHYSSIHRGLTILSCRPCEGEENEALRAWEVLARDTKGTRTITEELALKEINGNLKPPDDYNELKLNLGTFCGLLHTLFGGSCQYYIKCYALWKVLSKPTVFAKRQYFKPLLCRQIIWAIIEDGREYFSNITTKRHFDMAKSRRDMDFPQSHLDDVASSAQFQSALDRPTFPKEWGLVHPGRQLPQQRTHTPSALDIGPTLSNHPPTNDAPTVISGQTTASSRRTTPNQPRAPAGVRQTDIHSGLKALMTGHLRTNTYITLRQVLNHAGLTIKDLPTLDKYMDGDSNTLCYNYVLGGCTSKFCTFKQGHAPSKDVTNDFANKMITILEGPLNDFNSPAVAAARVANKRQRE